MQKIKPYIPYIIFGLCAMFLILRAFFGFCSSDEPFYLSTTKRLFDGDLIFAEEWFPTQLSSLIILPLYALFVTVTGGTDGIILFFRIVYILTVFVISCASYRILNKRNGSAAAFCCAFFMLNFVHLNIATLSYYTMSFEFFIFSMLLLMPKKRSLYILSGFIFALSVLSLPSLAIAYAVAFITVFCLSFKFRFLREGLIYTTFGIGAALILFLIYLYASGNSIGNLFEFLPYVLSDDEHQTSLVAPFKKFFTSISDVYGKVFYLSFVLAFLGLLSNRFKKLVPYIFAADCLLFIWYGSLSLGHTGYMNTALALFAGPLFFMCAGKDLFSFISLFIGGLIFSMTYSYSSNGELYVLSIGHGIACVASILFIFDFIRCTGDDPSAGIVKKLIPPVLIFIISLFLLHTAVLRFINVYRDAPLTGLTVCLTEGPAAGLYTTDEHSKVYTSVLSDIKKYSKDEGYVLFSKLLPWGYLACDMRCAAPSTWRNMINSKRLEEFYSLYPDRKPDTVFVLDADVGSYDTCGDIEADPVPNENEWGGILGMSLESEEYKRIPCDHLTVYMR